MRVSVERTLVHGSCFHCGAPIDGIALTVTVPSRGSESWCAACEENPLRELRDEERFRSNLRRKILEGGRPDLAVEAESVVLDLNGLDAH